MADDNLMDQGDIEQLLKEAKDAGAAAPLCEASDEARGEGEKAEQAIDSISSNGDDRLPGGAAAFRFEEFSGSPASTETTTLDLIRDVELDMKIELGRTHMYIEDVLKLRKGSVVSLDKLAGDPVDVYVNGRLIARGEVLVLNDNFCVRVTELISGTNVA